MPHSEMTGVIFDIARNSYVDGPGIRTTVFFKGCNLRCRWCHNPEGQLPAPQMLLYRDKCRGCGACTRHCPRDAVAHPDACTLCGHCTVYCPADARQVCGRVYTVDEVFGTVSQDRAFYDASGGGVTFSGGECMLQPDFLTAILERCRAAGISTAVDTAACVPFSSFERVMPVTDLFLVDVKLMDSARHRTWTGMDNALILANIEKLAAAGCHLIIRTPVIPGVNDTEEEIGAIGAFLKPLAPEAVELLPYHPLGENKYRAAGFGEPTSFKVPSPETMTRLREVMRETLGKG